MLVFFVILLVPLFVESYYFCRGMPDGLYCDGNTPVECMDEFANYGDDCGLCWCHSGTCDCEQTCEDGGLFSGTNIRCPTYVEQEGKWGCDAYYDDNRCCPNNQYAVDHGYYLACDASGGDCSPQGDQVLLYLIQSTEMFPSIDLQGVILPQSHQDYGGAVWISCDFSGYACENYCDGSWGGDSCSLTTPPPLSCSALGGVCCVEGDSCVDGPGWITNPVAGDCSALCCDGTCESEPTQECGNDVIEGDEECDDGVDNGVPCPPAYGGSCDYCSNDCELITLQGAYCGDWNTDYPSETCDDGNIITEECNYGETSCTVCDSGCNSIAGETDYCGDGTTDPGYEECDDGGTIPGDGCDENCNLETNCIIYSANWSVDGSTIADGNIFTDAGNVRYLVIKGNLDCDGHIIDSIDYWDVDFGPLEDDVLDPVHYGLPIAGDLTFEGDTISYAWSTMWFDDTDDLANNNPDYEFRINGNEAWRSDELEVVYNSGGAMVCTDVVGASCCSDGCDPTDPEYSDLDDTCSVGESCCDTCLGSCAITEFYWSETQVDPGTTIFVKDGTTVNLIIKGTDCVGTEVGLTYYELQPGFDPILDPASYDLPPATAIFSAGNEINEQWDAVWFDDGADNQFPDYMFRINEDQNFDSNILEVYVNCTDIGSCCDECDGVGLNYDFLDGECSNVCCEGCLGGGGCSGQPCTGSQQCGPINDSWWQTGSCEDWCDVDPICWTDNGDGTGTRQIQSDCVDDSDGDNIGVYSITYIEFNISNSTQVFSETVDENLPCFLNQAIPFFDSFAIGIVLFILIGFYFTKRKSFKKNFY